MPMRQVMFTMLIIFIHSFMTSLCTEDYKNKFNATLNLWTIKWDNDDTFNRPKSWKFSNKTVHVSVYCVENSTTNKHVLYLIWDQCCLILCMKYSILSFAQVLIFRKKGTGPTTDPCGTTVQTKEPDFTCAMDAASRTQQHENKTLPIFVLVNLLKQTCISKLSHIKMYVLWS